MTPDTLRECLVFPMLILISILGSAGSPVWPVCGLWVAIGYARSGQFSIGAGLYLCVLGLVQDALYEAPFGTWPLTFFAAWIIATGYAATLAQLFAERIGALGRVVVTVAVSIVAVDLAVTLTGGRSVDMIDLAIDLAITALGWPVVAPLLLHRHRA